MIYDLKCLECGKEFEAWARLEERHKVKCGCGGQTKILITNSQSDHWFKPHYNEEFTGQPIYVETLGQYKDLCKKHGVTSRALGDIRNCYEKERDNAIRQLKQ